MAHEAHLGRTPGSPHGPRVSRRRFVAGLAATLAAPSIVEDAPALGAGGACAAGILGGQEIWAPMALSDGKLLIRDQSRMKCLDVKAP